MLTGLERAGRTTLPTSTASSSRTPPALQRRLALRYDSMLPCVNCKFHVQNDRIQVILNYIEKLNKPVNFYENYDSEFKVYAL